MTRGRYGVKITSRDNNEQPREYTDGPQTGRTSSPLVADCSCVRPYPKPPALPRGRGPSFNPNARQEDIEMREISLTQGHVALIDDGDYELVSVYKWCVHHVSFVKAGPYAINGGTQILMHRLILGATAGQQCDHRNGNGLDNRRANLRFCTTSQNQQNRRKQDHICGKACSSVYKGVDWHKSSRCWRARIRHRGKQTYLGLFGNEYQAAAAYDTKAKELFGEFALTNFTR